MSWRVKIVLERSSGEVIAVHDVWADKEIESPRPPDVSQRIAALARAKRFFQEIVGAAETHLDDLDSEGRFLGGGA